MRAQDIPLPLGGDDAAVKKFAQKVEALKRKVSCARAWGASTPGHAALCPRREPL